MPRVAELPPGWPRFSTADKIKHLFGMSLDQARDILSWPRAELDPLRLSLQVQVMRIILIIGGKALLDGTLDREIARERERDAALARMVSELPSRRAGSAVSGTGAEAQCSPPIARLRGGASVARRAYSGKFPGAPSEIPDPLKLP